MFVDALLRLSSAQAFTTDAVSTNTIDLGDATVKRRIGTGEPLCGVVTVTVAGAGAGVYEFQIIESAAENLGSATVVGTTGSLAEASVAAGAIHIIPIAPGRPTLRYLGANFNNVSGTTGVTANIDIMPMSEAQSFIAYAKNYTIS